jgi:hypothetical protein
MLLMHQDTTPDLNPVGIKLKEILGYSHALYVLHSRFICVGQSSWNQALYMLHSSTFHMLLMHQDTTPNLNLVGIKLTEILGYSFFVQGP